MRYLRLIGRFMRASFQEEAAYRSNFFISIFYSLLNLGTGVLGVSVLFSQVEDVRGWSFASTLALLGVYLTVSALRSLFIGPGFDALAGMNGEIWSGSFDFTVLRPLNIQFFVSVRKWRWFSIFDLLLGLGVLGVAIARLGQTLSFGQAAAFIVALAAGVLTLYADPAGIHRVGLLEPRGAVYLAVQRRVPDGALPGGHVPRLAAPGAHLGDPGWGDHHAACPGANRRFIPLDACWRNRIGAAAGVGRIGVIPNRAAPLCQRIELTS